MTPKGATPQTQASFAVIRERIAQHLASRLGSKAATLDTAERFQRLGLDSIGTAAMLIELGQWLGRALSPTLAWQYPTPDALAGYLSGASADPPQSPASSLRGTQRPAVDESIAIIGMACRFPKAPDLRAYWELLRDGVSAVTEVPPERWSLDEFYDPDPAAPGKTNSKWGGFLSFVDTFDPGFFGISPREAVHMDPQQRLSLELSWEALEDARIAPLSLRDSRTGVFLGAMWVDYARLLSGAAEDIVQHTATGQDASILSGRVSYSLGLNGPSLSVGTASSSSLVAVHLACQSLQIGRAHV